MLPFASASYMGTSNVSADKIANYGRIDHNYEEIHERDWKQFMSILSSQRRLGQFCFVALSNDTLCNQLWQSIYKVWNHKLNDIPNGNTHTCGSMFH